MLTFFIILLLSPLIVFGKVIPNFEPLDANFKFGINPEIPDFFQDIVLKPSDFHTELQPISELAFNDDYQPWNKNLRSISEESLEWIPTELEKYTDENGLNIVFNASCYKPEEIEVKAFSDHITVKGKHETNENKHSSSCNKKESIEYRYDVPLNVDLKLISATISSDGILTIKAPFTQGRKIPIVLTGKPNKQLENNQDVNNRTEISADDSGVHHKDHESDNNIENGSTEIPNEVSNENYFFWNKKHEVFFDKQHL